MRPRVLANMRYFGMLSNISNSSSINTNNIFAYFFSCLAINFLFDPAEKILCARYGDVCILNKHKELNVEDTLNVPAPRTPLNLEVQFKRNYAREETIGTLKNISITGAFLEIVSEDVRTNEKLNLFFIVAGRERKIAAHVIWKNSEGCGVKFMPTNNRDVQIVDDLIYFVENGRLETRSVMDSIFKKVS